MAFSSWIRSWKRSVERRWTLYQTLRRKAIARRRPQRPRLEALEDRWLLSSYTVTSTADTGSTGTLREAINQANMAGSTITEIDFKIGTSGSAQTINLTSQLPTLTANGVFINGLSQGGSGKLITLNGTGAGSSSDGLLLQGSGNIVSGLILSHFTKNGIEVAGNTNTIGGTTTGAGNVISGNSGDGVLIDSGTSGNLVGGNFLGLNASGSTVLANSGNGLEVQGTKNSVGGSVLAARNYISGNSKDGVLLGSSASGNQVLGNFIGLNISGTLGVANLNGVEIAGSSNTLGSTVSGGFNFISANTNDGVLIDATAKNNLVQSNDIGTDYTGQKAIANSIGIEVAGAGNTLGGTIAAARNIVSGNSSDGVKLDSTGSGTVLLGNSIGVNAIDKALGNGVNGLNVLSTANTIGGTASGARNVLSGNSKDGLLIASGASGNQVIGNYIGTNIYGTAALANSGNGIEIAGTGNTIGGTASAARNVISGNTGDGVLLDSTASGNQVLGSYIGTNAAGNAAMANKVGIEDAGTGNILGGSVNGARNVLSGNSGDGILLDSTATGETVQGNFLGLNPSGNAALANGTNGIEIQGTKSTIGGTVLAARNYISGNSNAGLLIDSSASSNLVLDNFIGVDISGTHGVGNVNYGISLAGSNNTLGGTSAAYTNIISGSSKDGLLIASTATGNLIQGNDVGTDYSGQKAVGNSIGIEVMGSNNTLGGTAAGARNIVAGNSSDGVKLDSTGSGTVLLGNLIGVSAINKALANSGNGLDILSVNNTVGGTATGARNVLSGNSKDGLLLASGASGNQVLGNYIGTDIYTLGAVTNGSNGVEIAGSGNTIGGTAAAARNIISGNTNDGVLIDSGASGNQVLGNYIGTNSGGTASVANKVGVEDAGSGNVIGGSVSGARNIISGNSGDGVLLDSSATGEVVQGNFLGLNAGYGNAALANGNNGLDVQGTKNTIGGTVYFERNYISGNSNDGLFLGSSASGNLVLDNFIGIDLSGTNGVANLNGVEIAGSGNTLGGTVSGSLNAISANKNDGILIDSTGSGNLVLGNDVGTDYAGRNALANSGIGIEVKAVGNTLGGTASAARNIVSGNSLDGVRLDSTASGTVLLGNYIGVNALNAALANGSNGLNIFSSNNTVGGTASGTRNFISSNTNDGVLIASGASGNQVVGNYLGLNIYGTAALSNGSNGIEIGGTGNTVGGTAAAARNVISGNTSDGVLIDSSASGNQVLGNYLGTNYAGNAGIANSGNGIEDGGSGNILGGSVNGARNVISGNSGDGVLLDGSASGDAVQGNYIGLTVSGTGGLANGTNGVEIQGTNSTVGGTVLAARNYISFNSNDGVLLSNNGNLVLDNFIGVDTSGTNGVGNANYGVFISGNNNTVGGTSAGTTNVISGSGATGVFMTAAASGNLLQGNDVGTDYSGQKAVSNFQYGVYIAGNSNTVGGTVSGARNIISGNGQDGVRIFGNSDVVEGDYVGVNALGAALGNGRDGVLVAGVSNTVGGTVSGARNVISGNGQDGVELPFGATNNLVLGNYIGLNPLGTAALANSIGVEIADIGNTVGGTTSAARNIISGNGADGVLIDSTASGTLVQGNYIGTNSAGTAAVANFIGLEVASNSNTIGGTASGAGNVISGNGEAGVWLDSTGAGNVIQSNYVGTDSAGKNAVANGIGIEDLGNSNTIGGTASGAGNIISGNSSNGVNIDTGASGTLVQGNSIGINVSAAALANSGEGVFIAGNNNTIGGTASGAANTIADNMAGGVLVDTGNGNTISQNSIYANGSTNTGPGITLNSGANNNIAAPTLSSAILSSGTSLEVTGSFTAATANVSYVLEFFANPTGDAEGKVYLGSMTVTPTTTGTQNFTFTTTTTVTGTNPLITATVTDNLGDTSAFSSGVTVTPSAAVLGYHNNDSSTGQNLTETNLTPSNVNSTTFGKLFATTVDGQVYAQPLYDPGVNITTGTNQGTHNVVFVATQHDSLYAIDAATGTILWHDALLHAVHGGTVTTVPNSDVNSSDISPEIGVTATPIIDPSTNILYVEAKTKEVATDGSHYIHQLYAINLSNGSFVNGSPIVVADSIGDTYVSGPSVNGTGDGSSGGVLHFDALRQQDRPGLTIANGNVYLAFASHGDVGPYHGWVLSYSLSTLTLNGVLNTTPNGGLGGIWMGGNRLPVDASGNLYFETGNGTFETTLDSNGMPSNGDYGDAFVKIALDPTTSPTNQNINGWGLKVVDYFTPFDQATLNNNDWDLGSGGPILLPDSVGSAAHPHLMVGSGKEGRIYLIDMDNMGHYNSNTDNVVEETNNTTITGSFGDPAYYNGQIYYFGGSNIGNGNDVGKTFSIANGVMSLTPTSQGPDSFSYPGDTPSISANGSINGIVWATDTGTDQLRAYNAAISNGTLSELYTSGQAANNRDTLTGSVVKFAVPTVADGLVFVGSSNALNVYGLIQAPTQAPAAPSTLAATALSGASIQLSWQDNSMYPNKANGFYIEQSTDGVHFTQVATASAGTTSYTVGGLQTSTTYAFRERAFNTLGDSAYSNTANATTSSTAPNLNFSNGFASSSSLLTLNGSAKVNGTNLELTDGAGNEARSAFSTSKVDITKFNTQFSFQLTGGSNTADGFTFCIQTAGNTALGGTGGALGYAGMGTSVAIKYDLYSNSGEGTNSTGLYTDGANPYNAGSIDLTGTGIDLHSGDVINVSMSYDGTTLKVTESDPTANATATQSYTVNIATTVGTSTAFVGFTGGTGGLTAVQNILSWTFTSGTPGTAPIAPVNSTAAAVSATEANVTWTNYASDQTGFHIDRATDPNFTQNLVTLTAPVDATSFVDPGLTVGMTYYYRVRAFNAFGDSPNSNTTSAVLPTLPAAVSNLTVTNITSSEIDLSWTNNATDAASIQVFRQLGENSSILIASLSPTTTSLADTGLVVKLKPGTTYLYSVHAMNAAGPSLMDSVTGTTASSSPALQLPNGGTNGSGSAVSPNKVDTPNSSTGFFLQLPNRSLGGGSSESGGDPSIGLDINGVAPTNAGSINSSGSGINQPSGDTFNVHMTYNGTSFMVRTTDTNTGDSATEDTGSWTYSTTT